MSRAVFGILQYSIILFATHSAFKTVNKIITRNMCLMPSKLKNIYIKYALQLQNSRI